MKARAWFFALGQSHEARRMPYALCVVALRLNHLPHWAKQAYNAGRLSVQHAGFAAMSVEQWVVRSARAVARARSDTPQAADSLAYMLLSRNLVVGVVSGDKAATASGHAHAVAGKSEAVS